MKLYSKCIFASTILLLGCDHGGLNDKYVRYTIANQLEHEVEFRVYASSQNPILVNQYTISPQDSLVWENLIVIEGDDWYSMDAMGGDSVRFGFPDGQGLSYPCGADTCSERRRILEYYFELEDYSYGVQVDSFLRRYTLTYDILNLD